MNKIKNIKVLIEKLKKDLKGIPLEFVDHWDSDPYAVGIAKRNNERKLVYISVFKEKSGKYYYECETPVGKKLTDYKVVAEGDKVSYKKLIYVIRKHLTNK